jgi:large subunit ribosomal protein L13
VSTAPTTPVAEGSEPKQKSIGREVFQAVKAYCAKPADVKPVWFIVDAKDQIVGRLAVKIATILMGKHRPTYTPHVACGDFVIVVNADKVRFTGARMAHDSHDNFTKKMAVKEYQHYTGYPSGRKVELGATIIKRKPTFILHEAVRRMLPKNKLQSVMLSRLKLYVGTDHPHQAQQPEELKLS